MAMFLSQGEQEFCAAVVKLRSPARAYFQLYGCDLANSYAECEAAAARIMRNPAVKARIAELKADREALKFAAEKIDIPKVLEKFLLLTNADPNELTSLRVGCCRYCHGSGFRYQWTVREYSEKLAEWERVAPTMAVQPPMPDPAGGLEFDRTREPHPDCPECGGEGLPRIVLGDTANLSDGGRLLFQGVKETKDGVQILMADRLKALESVARILGAYKDTMDAAFAYQAAWRRCIRPCPIPRRPTRLSGHDCERWPRRLSSDSRNPRFTLTPIGPAGGRLAWGLESAKLEVAFRGHANVQADQADLTAASVAAAFEAHCTACDFEGVVLNHTCPECSRRTLKPGERTP
jgi:phage terminase small subunit